MMSQIYRNSSIFHQSAHRILSRAVSALILFLILTGSLFSQKLVTRIKSYSTEDGLSSQNISSIAQDKIGYLWIGTDDGLNRFDGNSFRVYRNDPGDSLSLSDTRVTALYATVFQGKPELWVGTRNGLNRLDLKTGNFKTYFPAANDSRSLSHPTVTSITGDESGSIWVGTENGLNLLEVKGRDSGRFLRFLHTKPGEDYTNSNFIRKVLQGYSSGDQKQLWVATRDGLKSINYSLTQRSMVTDFNFSSDALNVNKNDIRTLFIKRQKKQVFVYAGTEAGELYKIDVFNANLPPKKIWTFDSFIRSIYIDSFRHMWVATYGRGLYQFVENENELSQQAVFEGLPELKNSLSNSHTTDLFMDVTGVLWVATDNGLNAILGPVQGFTTLQHEPGNINSLSGSGIRSVYENAYGILWVGTVSNGLTRIDRQTGVYRHFYHDPIDESTLGANSISAILEDRYGTMWFGTWEGGLSMMNSDGKTFTRYQYDPDDEASLPHNVVQGMLEDREGRIWLNTGNGLSRYNRGMDKFINYSHNPDDSTTLSAGDPQSKAMYLDRFNRLWIGTYGGGVNRLDLKQINNLNPETAVFDHFYNNPNDIQSPSSDLIISLAGSREDDKDVLWLGSFNGGLTRLQYHFEGKQEVYSYKRYSEAEGLCDNVIFGIEVDRRNALWLSTGDGLSRFDPDAEHFTNFYVEDGLPANGFFWGASNHSAKGEMFFGGTEGLVHFFPDGIAGRQTFAPTMTISDVKLMNSRISTRPRDYNHSQLLFDYRENIFTIEWALFDFVNPAKNRYHYLLEGFQDEWVSAGNKNSVTYSNLPGGEYTFRVRGSNYNGVEEQEEANLTIRIVPPFWKSLPFRFTVLLGLLILVYGIVTIRTKVMQYRNHMLRERNEKLNLLIKKRDQAEEKMQHTLDEKEVLLREIYHRTKNNMSVIISLLNLQAAGIDKPELTEMFDEIKGRIYAMSLVHDQLMKTKDLSVIDLNNYVRQLIDNLMRSYSSVGSRVSTFIKVDAMDVSIDTAVPLGLVMNEIITNSLKYAFPENREGEISVFAQLKHNKLFLKISDDGIGFVETEDQQGRKTLGTRIIHTVVEDQLDGELKLDSSDGTSYEILLADIEIVRRV